MKKMGSTYLLWVSLIIIITGFILIPYCIMPEIDNTLKIHEVKNLQQFLNKIILSKTILSKYKTKNFSYFNKNNLSDKKLIKKFFRDINKILALPNFYEEKKFSNVNIPKQLNIKKLLKVNKKSYEILYLNKLLLYFAFPNEIEKPKNYWIHKPTLKNFLLFGTYKQKNLLYLVAQAINIALYISSFALLISILFGFVIILFDFCTKSIIRKCLQIAVYFPRLFFLIILASFLNLQITSKLNFSVEFYLILAFGFTGAIFLSSQISNDVTKLKQQTFVYFAKSIKANKLNIFFKHILKNCTTLPIIIIKQMRDNIMFISILTFVGVVQLQPSDIGGLIYKYYNSPETFYQGWWILFFPCLTLIVLILLFDLISINLTKYIKGEMPLI